MTGRPLDLALRGRGFFVVDTPAGRRYTRKGRICLNSEGELIDGNGNRFVADSGTLRIPEDAEGISISRSGEVVAGEERLGQLAVVDIPQPERLVAEGWSLYRNDGQRATPAVGAEVVQGAIEQSNVNVVNETVSLVQIMRAYETASRIVKRMDALNGQLVRSAA
jgi:flagellar basal-body rod protein FlgF